jgi:hypothetical protein
MSVLNTTPGARAQYLPSRAYRLITGNPKVMEFHSYAVDVGAIIIDMEIVSGHDSAPTFTGGSTGLSAAHARGSPAGDQ